MINCPYCGKLTDPKLDSCVHCGGYLQRRQPAAGGGGVGGRGRRQTCPNCQAEVEEGAILCVACGTNLLTGQKISEERKAGRRKKPVPAWLIGVIVAAVIVVVLIGLLIVAVSGDPVNRAREMIAENNLLDAQELLVSHLADSPDDGEAQYMLGKIQLRNNRAAEAARSFERAFEVDEDNVDALKLAVVSYARAGDAASRANQARALERVVEEDSEDIEAWYLLGLTRGAQSNPAGQEEALRRVLELDPTYAPALRDLGIALALQGKYEEARQYLAQAQTTLGEDANLLAARGFLAALEDEPENAVGALVSAVGAQTAARELAQTELGKSLVALGRFAEAEKHLAQALTSAGRSAPDAARYFHGLALRALGRSDEAMSEFDILAKGSGPYMVDSAVQASQLYLERGNIARARETLESVATQGGSSAAFYTTRGRIFMLNGEDQRAEQAFQQAIQTDPNYPGGYLELGLLQLKQNSFENALNNLSRFLELTGESTDPQTQQVQTLVEQLRSTGGTMGATDLATLAPEAGQ